MATFQVRLPDGTIVDAPEGATRSSLREQYPASFAATTPETAPKEGSSEFVKGVKRGLGSSASLLTEGVPAVFRAAAEKLTGEDWNSEEAIIRLGKTLELINTLPDLKARVGDIRDIKSVDDAAAFLSGNVGQIAPDLLGSLGVGSLASLAAKDIAKTAAVTATKKALAKGATEEAAALAGKKAGRRVAGGALTAGTAAYNQAVMTPSELQGIYQETGEIAPGIAFGSAAVQNVGETLSDLALGGLGPLGGEFAGRGVKSILKAGGVGALTEGATEGAQALVSEGAQELANPDKATFDGWDVVNQAAAGLAGGPIRAGTQLLTGGKEAPKTQSFIKEKTKTSTFASKERVVSSENPETTPEAPTKPVETILPENEDVVQPVAENTTEEPSNASVSTPVEEKQPLITRKPAPAEAIAETSLQEKPAPFKLYSNVTDEEGMKYRSFIQESLSKVGFDEDVVYLDPNDDSDETWFGLDLAAPGIGNYRDQIKEMNADPKIQGGAAQFKADDGTMKHFFFVDRNKMRNSPETMRTFLHEGLGHTITNRFMLRDPEVRDGFVNLVKSKLNERGLETEGLSYNDISNIASSWDLDADGKAIPALDKDNAKFKFSPVVYGSRTDTALSEDSKDLQYRAAADEVLTEQVARWFQSNETPLTVMDKFFKTMADMYRSFIETARAQGLLPWREVEDFMHDLVLRAKGRVKAQQYTISPEGGIQELRAYHGTPHRFNKFTTEAIGTGEGYQAFGWGLYFTNNKGIADYYRKKLSGLSSSTIKDKNGDTTTWTDVFDWAKTNNIVQDRLDTLRLRNAFDNLALEGYSLTKASYENDLSRAYIAPDMKDRFEKELAYLNLLKKNGFDKKYENGAFYRVTIPEESEMLDWTASLDKQPEFVKKAIQDLGLVGKKTQKTESSWTSVDTTTRDVVEDGESLYEYLIREKGGQKEASLFLNSLGIKGVKYPAGTIAGVDSDSTNYVIFDDAAIEINQVYDDENIIAAFKKQEKNKEEDKVNTKSPFQGYVPALNPTIPNVRTNAFLKGFVANVNKEGYGARSNAVQQYLVMADALADKMDASYLPEVFRGYVKNTQAIPESVRNVLLNNRVHLTKVLDGLRVYYGVSKSELMKFSVVDVMGEAYKIYRIRNSSTGDVFAKADTFVSTLPPAVLKSFQAMDVLRNSLKTDLNKAGATSPTNLLRGVNNQTPPQMSSLIQEAQYIRNLADKQNMETVGLGELFIEEKHPLGDKRNAIAGGLFGRNVFVPRFIARTSAAFARVKSAADERREAITGMKHILFEGFKDFLMLPQADQDYLGNVMDSQRKLNNTAKVNPETGYLEFKRRNEETGVIENVVLEDKAISAMYEKTQKTFKTVPLLHRNQLRRAFTGLFGKANLGFEPTRQAFELYKQQLKEGSVAKANTLSPSQIAEVEQYFSMMDSFDRMLQKDYVPHIRFGTRGVTLKDEKGNTVWFGTFDVNNNGKNDTNSFDETMSSLEEFKKNYKGTLKQSEQFDLSVNSIVKQLGGNNRALTLELLSQLLSANNPKLFKEAMDAFQTNAEDLVQGKLSNKAFLNHFAEADKEDIKGYSTDWARVISSYGNSAAYFLGNMEYEPKLLTENSKLQNNSNSSKSLKDYSNSFVGNILNPEENFASLRELQYLYAMGLNPSSAILQLQSLFTYMPATLTLATNSHMQSVSHLAKASKLVPLFFSPNFTGKSSIQESLFAFGDDATHEKLIAKGKITRQQSDFIKSLYNKGVLQALRSGDMVGVPSDVSSRQFRGKLKKAFGNFSAASGVMMRTAEEATRGVQAFGAIFAMSEPDNVLRLHTNLLENDAYYRTKVEQSFSKEPDVNYLVQFLIDKSLGEFGKEARSPLQNSAASVTLIPFSTYPTQVLLNTYEYVSGKYGPEGRKAAVWALASTALSGGVKAVPAALLIKEIIEYAIKLMLGEDRDLDEELNKKAVEAGMPDLVRKIASNGVFSELLGIDTSSRMAVDVPFMTEFVKYLQDEQPMGISDLLGVQGTILASPSKVLEMAMQGRGVSEIIAATFPSVGVQNVIKSQANEQGVSYRGIPTLKPGEAPEGEDASQYGGEIGNKVKRALGFKPLAQGENERVVNALKREETRYKVALDRYKDPIKRSFKKELLAKDALEKQQVRDERNALIKELVEFMKEKNIPNINQSLRSLINGARLEAYGSISGMESGAIRKQLKEVARDNFDEINRMYK